MKKLKPIPKFKSEEEEAEFWAAHDSSEYFDISKAVVNPALPGLKSSTKTITLRVSQSLLDSLKMAANKRDVPYQSLIKVFLAQKLKEEFVRI